jgi:hypothetical protein
MKKLLVLLFIAVVAVACQMSSVSNTEDIKRSITYFKDESTGLCFAAINSMSGAGYTVTSITCVPCDSLKKIGIK